MEKEENKVSIREDGIVYIEIGKRVSEKGIIDLIDRLMEILKRLPKKSKILLNIGTLFLIRSSVFRKELSDKVKFIFQEYDFGKAAFYSSNIKTRTVVSFVITATGLKNMKVFQTQEQALNWLKECN